MATTDGDLFVDTNVWLYATDPASLWNTPAREVLHAMQTASSALVISPQVVREYLAAATRPGVVEPAPSLDDLLANVAGIRARCRLVDETVAVVDELARLLTAVPSAYRRVHDANIVATMLVWGVPRLLTNNLRDFERYAHLVTIIPLVSPAL